MDCLIITYYYANNYGSFLQALALKQFFESKGVAVKFWASKKYDTADFEKDGYKSFIGNKLSEAKKEFEFDYNLKHKYDFVVVGSDVVWASTKIKPFWGIGVKGKHFYTYAASIYGMCSNLRVSRKIENLLIHLRLLKRYFSVLKFKKITVRDEKTMMAIKKIRPFKRIEKVLDPTFLLDMASFGKERIIPEKYILVYSYGLVGEDINCVFEYSKKHDCKICVVGHKAAYADYNLAPSPYEVISLFKNAEVVITTTFHGTALAIENNKDFVVFESKKGKELLCELNLNDRLVTSKNASLVLEKHIDYRDVNTIIEKKRKTSISALEEMIGA